jgi:hypothetical protein
MMSGGPNSWGTTERRFAYQDGAGCKVEVLAVGYPSEVVGDYGYREVVALDNDGHRCVIWSMYDIGGRTFVIPIISQLWYGLRALTALPYSVLFALKVACVPSCAEGRSTVGDFGHKMGSELVATAATGVPDRCNCGPRMRSRS